MIKLATVFSGIGAIEQALKQMNIEYEIVFACDNGERYLDIDQKKIKKQIKGLLEEEKEKKIKHSKRVFSKYWMLFFMKNGVR